MFITLRNQILKSLILLFGVVLLVLHLLVPINLTAVDIGRHIKNGELILSGESQVLYKNFYSFTYPEYPFINHHWLFGVMSFVVFHLGGFPWLSVMYVLLLVLTLLLAFDTARRYSGFNGAIFFFVLSFLLLTSRAEIRPEGFSVFWVALDFWLLARFCEGTIKRTLLFAIVPLVQILWVNTHIFFFLGPMLIGIFLWQAIIAGKPRGEIRTLQQLGFLSLLVNLVNPSGLAGMLTPLNVFKKFGYPLAENQSIFFMIHRFTDNATYKYFIIVALIMGIGMILCWQREGKKALPMIIFGVFITFAAFNAVRLLMPFGFLCIPLNAYFYGPLVKRMNGVLLGIATAGMMLLVFCMPAYPAIGLMPGVNASAEFFKANGLRGPIFSNYDIGGYLIYHLQGYERVFVDNRQEAFPPDFFEKIYIPMQENEKIWKDIDGQDRFNVIYFYRQDLTPWGQKFLVDRVGDPQWAPVFVDYYTIIFLKRGSVNQSVIDRFELPKSMFKVKTLGERDS